MRFVFRDTTGREWNLKVTAGIANRLRDDKVIDIYSLFNKGMDGLKKLMSNATEFMGVAWEIIRPQAEAQGVSFVDWSDSLDGDSIDSLLEILPRAILDFSPRHQRELGLKALDKGNEVQRHMRERAEKKLAGIDPEAMAAKAARLPELEMDRAIQELTEPAGGDGSGTVAASSD